MTNKPTILYVGRPIVFAHEAWARFERRFNILTYDCQSRSEVIQAFSEGGKYSKIDGIIRPNFSTNVLPPLDKELIGYLPSSCKIVSYCNHGYDGEDTLELERRGIWFCNGAGGATESTADVGLFLILATFRFTTFMELTLREKQTADWFNVEDACKESHEPGGKVLGIVGLGEIGAAVARRARAIGMEIHHFSRVKKPALEESLGNSVYHATIESLLEVSDCVLLACPHTPETHHILNMSTLKLMKRGSRVVNIARGKCIDEEALVEALEEGHISSAGLDVFHDEPVVNPRLLSNRRVTLLPHIAGNTLEADKKFEELAMENIEIFFLGDGKLLTPVNNVLA
ncbi:related to D-mandelate dehydrogenase [Cephalotrichum gorgonifer]|uniref:Related to D-mandelate dehydrogenase n=1 Tax=Cephalotrichum gorgonifer TaxID=2041049 RepID=A0AAE8N8Z9_9PEZI|nr:related to D-mandelate dehydrogenase [Cephalotrichum gorgonifer]